jgi:MoaA/NifB/PqqE/SkfB family radical SAM enzyme
LRRGRLGLLARAAWRSFALKRELQAPSSPLFATLAVTYRCNYRCEFCDLPDRARGDPPLEKLVERVDLLARGGALALGITGGEPLLHPQLFELLKEARRRFAIVHLNTNGSRLAHDRIVPLLAAGLHSVNVSLDGARPQTHDAIRRVPGSFEQIRRTVSELLARRRGATPRVALVMALTRSNWREARDFAALAKEWDVDACGWLPEHDFLLGEPRREEGAHGTTTSSRPAWPAADVAQLRELLLQAADECELVDNSPAYLEGVTRFLGGTPTPTSCSAGRSHVAVDPDGRRFPCVPLMTLERSSTSAADRADVCRRCWWNCHRELDLSLDLLPA